MNAFHLQETFTADLSDNVLAQTSKKCFNSDLIESEDDFLKV